jgi:hypothetical protein
MSESSFRRAVEQQAAESATSEPSDSAKLSDAQLAANRANAQHSTGPTSAAGKAKVSLNAVKTGLTGRTVLLSSEACNSHARPRKPKPWPKPFRPTYSPLTATNPLISPRLALNFQLRNSRCISPLSPLPTKNNCSSKHCKAAQPPLLVPKEPPKPGRPPCKTHQSRLFLGLKHYEPSFSFAHSF